MLTGELLAGMALSRVKTHWYSPLQWISLHFDGSQIQLDAAGGASAASLRHSPPPKLNARSVTTAPNHAPQIGFRGPEKEEEEEEEGKRLLSECGRRFGGRGGRAGGGIGCPMTNRPASLPAIRIMTRVHDHSALMGLANSATTRRSNGGDRRRLQHSFGNENYNNAPSDPILIPKRHSRMPRG